MGILVGSVLGQTIGLFVPEGSVAHQLFVQYEKFGFGPTPIDLVAFDVDGTLIRHPEGKTVWEIADFYWQAFRSDLAKLDIIEPDVLLMDEPLSALDENLREEMRVEVSNLQEMLGITSIFVTHDQREALTMIALEGRGHAEVAAGDGVPNHTEFHLEALSCQVCHSTTYKNCYSCHVSLEEDVAVYKIEPSVMDFKIGLNPLQSEDRPWKYVPVRHVPIDPEAFAYYGEDLLPNFDALPTWKYATPHNIQRNTPQTETCDTCHGNEEIFLTADKIAPEELDANLDVIVDAIPSLELVGGSN